MVKKGKRKRKRVRENIEVEKNGGNKNIKWRVKYKGIASDLLLYEGKHDGKGNQSSK